MSVHLDRLWRHRQRCAPLLHHLLCWSRLGRIFRRFYYLQLIGWSIVLYQEHRCLVIFIFLNLFRLFLLHCVLERLFSDPNPYSRRLLLILSVCGGSFGHDCGVGSPRACGRVRRYTFLDSQRAVWSLQQFSLNLSLIIDQIGTMLLLCRRWLRILVKLPHRLLLPARIVILLSQF